ncbi:MAG: PAS domain S-box protein [Rufibacter sp.]
MEERIEKRGASIVPDAALEGESHRAEAGQQTHAQQVGELDLEESLLQYQRQLKAMQAELERARHDLQAAKAETQKVINQKLSLGLLQEISEYRRIMELERLGKEVLELNAKPGSTLESTVAHYLQGIEKVHKGMLCSCMRLDGQKLYSVAAPSLPESFRQAIDGLTIGMNVGSCGTAAFLTQKVISTDVETDPHWKEYYPLLLSYGLKACWSFPLIGTNQKVLGTVAVYYQEVKAPTREEEESLESIRHVLQLIVENKLAEAALRQSNERFLLASSASYDTIYDWYIPTDSLHWGVGFETLFGVKREPENSTLSFWEKRVHPEDKEELLVSLHNALQDGTQNYWQVEYRIIRLDNTVLYVNERGFILRNEQNQAIRMVGAVQDITVRKQAEEELRRLSVIAKETINGVMIMTPHLTIQWVNDAFTRMMGYSLEEVQGRTPGSFLNGEETSSETIQLIDGSLERLEQLECELVQYSKTRQKRWLRLQVQPLLDKQGQVESIFALFTDITKEKEEEQQLRLLESVVTNAHEAISISQVEPHTPHQLRTIFFNKAFTELTGYTEEEILGKDPLLLNGPETNLATVAWLEELIKTHHTGEVELLNYRKNGEKFWALLSVVPIFNKEGTLTHWISMQRDITGRKQYEEERELLIAELTQNNSDLKQFSYITSHNLRAPLSNLMGLINLIDMKAVPEGRNKLLIEKFKDSTFQLSTIINDLMEVLVIKNNPRVKKEPLSLEAAFEKVVLSVEDLVLEAQPKITTSFEAVPEVDFNPGYLHSILLNLLTNAMRYRSPERPLEIEVKSEQQGDEVLVHFSDNGLGIDLERYGDRIFGLYQRFHHHKDSKGMGLYIAHSQAKAMGGDLVVASEVHKGTTFTLRINKTTNG